VSAPPLLAADDASSLRRRQRAAPRRRLVGGEHACPRAVVPPSGVAARRSRSADLAETYPVGLAYDGTDYVATFRSRRVAGLFAARLAPDGTVRDPEAPGLLVSGRRSTDAGVVAAGWRDSVVVWRDRRFRSDYDAVFAQRLLPHAPPSVPAASPIGAVGPRSVTEGDVILVAVSARPRPGRGHAPHRPAAGADLIGRACSAVLPPIQAGVLPRSVRRHRGVQSSPRTSS
jgi:hypothetical protein